MARATTQRLFLSFTNPLQFPRYPLPIHRISIFSSSFSATAIAGAKTSQAKAKKKTKTKEQEKSGRKNALSSPKAPPLQELLKKRTRSGREFDKEFVKRFGDAGTHIPAMLGEVLDVFASSQLRSFVDCTLGAAGEFVEIDLIEDIKYVMLSLQTSCNSFLLHCNQIIQTHPELQVLVGLDVDPVAHKKAKARINSLVNAIHIGHGTDFKAHIYLKNFREIKRAICEVDQKLVASGVDGILMDLGIHPCSVAKYVALVKDNIFWGGKS